MPISCGSNLKAETLCSDTKTSIKYFNTKLSSPAPSQGEQHDKDDEVEFKDDYPIHESQLIHIGQQYQI